MKIPEEKRITIAQLHHPKEAELAEHLRTHFYSIGRMPGISMVSHDITTQLDQIDALRASISTESPLIAVPLMSPHFIASGFEPVSYFAEGLSTKSVTLAWVYARDCRVEDERINAKEPLNTGGRSLAKAGDKDEMASFIAGRLRSVIERIKRS